jgi:hypothetical protein
LRCPSRLLTVEGGYRFGESEPVRILRETLGIETA